MNEVGMIQSREMM